MTETIKQKIINEIYSKTHSDYKSIIKGQKCIMYLDENGITTLGNVELSPKFKKRFEEMSAN